MKYRDRILRAAVVALLLYAMGCLAGQYRLLCRTEALAAELAQRHEELAARRQELTQLLEKPPDEREMRRLAWERLGMVAPGEKVFYFPLTESDREDTVWDWKLEALWKDG
jgi:cell division protein FtsB